MTLFSANDSFINTLSWRITLGVNAGYELEGQKELSMEELSARIGKVADAIQERTGIYISCVLSPARTLYKAEWGCPIGGEISYTLSGSCNPAFSDPDPFYTALKLYAQDLREEFSQSTLTLEVFPTHIDYLQGDQ